MTNYRDYDPLMGTGYFDIWLEGTSFSTPASGTFVASLFRTIYDGSSGTFTISQGGGPMSQGATNGLRWNQTAAGSGGTARMIEARIEDGTIFNADKATLSFYIVASQDGVPVQAEVVQFFGSGGNPNGPGGNASSDVTVLSKWFCATQGITLHTFTMDVPSTAGKYFGANFDDCLKVRIKFPANNTFDVTLHELRIERGPERTPFSHVPLALKWTHINRQIQVLSISMGGNAPGANTYLYESLPFRGNMRRVPTVSWAGATRGNLYTGAPENGAPVATYMKDFGGCAYIRSAGAGAFYAIDEYLKLDARL